MSDHRDQVERIYDEIGQLRADKDAISQTASGYLHEIERLENELKIAIDEIARLRAGAEQDARLRQTCLELRDEARQENKQLRAEIERLQSMRGFDGVD